MVAIRALNTRIHPTLASQSTPDRASRRLAIRQLPTTPATLQPRDTFIKDKKPQIKQLALQAKKDKEGNTTGFEIILKNGTSLSIPSSRLSRDNLVSEMISATREFEVSSAKDLSLSAQDLIQNIRASASALPPAVESIRKPTQELGLLDFDTPSLEFTPPALAQTELPKAQQPDQAPLTKTQLQNDLQQMQQVTQASLLKIKQLAEHARNPKSKRVLKKMGRSLQRLEKALMREQPLNRSEKMDIFAERLLQKMMHKLAKHGNPTEKAQRLQVLANITRSFSPEESTPEAMLKQIKNLFPGQRQDLEQVTTELEHEFGAFALTPDPPTVKDMLGSPLSSAASELFQELQDIPQSELLTILSAADSIDQDMVAQWTPSALNLQNSLQVGLQGISEEALALIEKAENLARSVELVPTPQAIKGFKDGALSLIREFLRILQELDQDLKAIMLDEFQKTLETRLLDQQFMQRILDAKAFDQMIKSQRDKAEKLLEERLHFMVESFKNPSLN